MRHLLLLATGSALVLSGCTVGPNYAGPPATGAGAPRASFVRATTETATAPTLGQWWTTLGDPLLDSLEQRALAANPSIAVAEARLRQARASLRLERANQAPSASASATYLHARIPGVDLGGSGGSGDGDTNLNFYNLGFDASWELDLFGGQRRKVEAQRASAEAALANLSDAQVSLTAEVAQAYIQLRDRQRRIALSDQSIEMQRQTLALTSQRYDRGAASSLDVERLQTQLESSTAQRLPLSAELQSYLNALAVLTGVEPGALDAELKPVRPVPLPPAAVAVGDPASLLQRRPDIRAAERQLAASTAQIGVASAARFPTLKFFGILGLGGTDPGDVVDIGKLAAIGAPMLQWNFLDFGRNKARVTQAEAKRDEAEANYRLVVLGALQDAEDSLSRFGARRSTLASIARVKASADRASGLMQQRYRAGTATLIDTLDAERQRVSADQNLSTATAGLTNDYVALQKALGLGWTTPAAPSR